jgi:prepilin-type N-terminal cleavage/methylation domain-containing protein
MRIGHRHGGAAGITLIELMVALALVGVVLAAAGTMLLQAYANEAAYREQNAAQQNARTAADSVTDDLRGAVKGSVREGSSENPTADKALTFTIVDDTGASKPVRYWLSGTDLMREVGTGGNGVAVARNITWFTVKYTGNPAIVSVTAKPGGSSGAAEVKVTASVTLRNYLL